MATTRTSTAASVTHRLGTYGIWLPGRDLSPELAVHLERLGFGAIWIGSSPSGDLELAEQLLDATESIVVATGIVNIWASDAALTAASYHRVVAKHSGRFLLGVGASHPEFMGPAAEKPYEGLSRYLDILDAEGVPRDEIVLAALGPRVLRLARDRTAGAHPYLVTPEHTRAARELLGAGPLLAPEQRVVLETDAALARAAARPGVKKPYLGLVNYRNSLLRLGYSEEDLAGDGSDRLIDDLVVYGTPATIVDRLEAHFDAGADHVAIQLVATEDDSAASFTALAAALELAPYEQP
jgi:probable F420-dependent oxidoreductase